MPARLAQACVSPVRPATFTERPQPAALTSRRKASIASAVSKMAATVWSSVIASMICSGVRSWTGRRQCTIGFRFSEGRTVEPRPE